MITAESQRLLCHNVVMTIEKGGRPTKYTGEIQQKCEEYYNRFRQLKTKVPFLEELELELDISRDTRVRWEKLHRRFSDTVYKVKTLQKLRLQQRVVYSAKNPYGEVFLLKANHDMMETEKRQIVGENGEPVRIQAIVEYFDEDEEDITEEELKELEARGEIR